MKKKKKKKFKFTQRILLTWIWTIHSFFMEFFHIPYQSSFILLLAKILDKPIVFLLGHQISKKKKKWWIPLIFFIKYKRLIVNLQNFSSIKRFNAQNEELDWIMLLHHVESFWSPNILSWSKNRKCWRKTTNIWQIWYYYVRFEEFDPKGKRKTNKIWAVLTFFPSLKRQNFF